MRPGKNFSCGMFIINFSPNKGAGSKKRNWNKERNWNKKRNRNGGGRIGVYGIEKSTAAESA